MRSLGYIVLLLPLVLAGCCTDETLEVRYKTFLADPSESQFATLDTRDIAATALLIGFLELHAEWIVAVYPDGQTQIQISAIGSGERYPYPDSMHDLVPRALRASTLVIRDPVVIEWAIQKHPDRITR